MSISLRRWQHGVLAAVLAAGLWLPSAMAFTIPANDGFVTDTVGVLNATQDADIERTLTDYRKETSNEIAVLLVPNLGGEDIAEVAVQVGRKWKVGSKEHNNGILILIAYNERTAMIATGYGLEGAVPDVLAKQIIDEQMAPRFREGQYYEGIVATINALKQAIGGEYESTGPEEAADVDYMAIIFVLLFIGANMFRFFGVWLAKTKSWWMGGLIGGVLGVVVAVLLAWWIVVPLLGAAGLFFDYFVSKYGWASSAKKRRNWYGRMGGGGGFGGGGGGFGGFGGGSFGGGGASGKW